LETLKQLYIKLKDRTVGSHELSSVYFKQVSATSVIKGFSVLISIIYVPIVLGFLDQTKYGIWVTLTTIVHWVRLADIGIAGGMRLKLSQAIATKDFQHGRIHVSTTYGIIGSIFLIVLTVFYFINPHLDWQGILNTTIISQAELVRITSITVTFFVLSFILQTVNMIYLSHGNSAAESLIHLMISGITLLLVWLTSRLATKGNLTLLATIVTGIPVLVYAAVSIYTYSYKFPQFRPSFKLVKVKDSQSLMILSLQSFVSTLTYLIIYGSVPFVVAHLFSPNEVTVYNIAYSMFNLPIMLISLVVMPIKPLVTLAYTKGDYNWIRMMLGKLKKISMLFVAGIIVMILLNQFIYRIWIGDKVVIPFILSASLGIFAIINVLQFAYSIIVLGTGKMIINIILSPINIGLFISLSILFSRLLNNVIGVSLALSVTCLIPLIVYPLWLKKVLSE
jgi:O-antigen/teichoic acid export membrane protein